MNLQQFGVRGCPWVTHILLWVRLLPPLCQRKLGTNLPGDGFPSWGLFHHSCLQSSWWLPKLLSPHELGGKLPPCAPLAAASSPTLLLISTQQGLGHGGVLCHYSLFHLLGASICQQHSSLWSNPSWAPLSLCPVFIWICHNPSCAWLGCLQPSPDALFQDGRFPHRQRVLPPLPHGPSHIPGDSAHTLGTALGGWSPSSY